MIRITTVYYVLGELYWPRPWYGNMTRPLLFPQSSLENEISRSNGELTDFVSLTREILQRFIREHFPTTIQAQVGHVMLTWAHVIITWLLFLLIRWYRSRIFGVLLQRTCYWSLFPRWTCQTGKNEVTSHMIVTWWSHDNHISHMIGTWWSHDCHMMVTFCSHDNHMHVHILFTW